jgi:hypothetical protein
MHGDGNGFGKLTRECGSRVENSDRNNPQVFTSSGYVLEISLQPFFKNMDK